MVDSNLPLELSSFIGRTAELERLPAVLEAVRLLTITGPGGVGKTRLALRVAAMLRDKNPDGVWLVDVSPAQNGDDVLRSVAGVLGADRVHDTRVDALLDKLKGLRLLIVLDNCEHVVGSCADLIRSILRYCPDVRVLATSRQVLAVEGEVVCTAPPLSLPGANETSAERLRESDAACLFLERILAALPTFSLTPTAVPRVAEICRRVEGVPLALELVAGRVRSFGLAEVASLAADHLRLLNLRANRVARPTRHRSLRASLDWSFDLLADTERVMLQRLALFNGGWTLQDARIVTTVHDGGGAPASVPDILDSLVAMSLIVAEHDDGGTRYRLPGLVRHYALEPAETPRTSCRQLTPREREVLALVARGYSNKEIGAELVITDATARVHVEHILTKLDLRSRTQAAVWALRQSPEW